MGTCRAGLGQMLLVAACMTSGCALLERAGIQNNGVSASPDEEGPPEVLGALERQWPNAEIITVEEEDENGVRVCEIKFRESSVVREVKYALSGELLEIEEEIGLEDLPDACRDRLNSRFPGGEVLKVEKVTGANGEQTYEAEVRHLGRLWEAVMSSAGHITGLEEEEDDDTE